MQDIGAKMRLGGGRVCLLSHVAFLAFVVRAPVVCLVREAAPEPPALL